MKLLSVTANNLVVNGRTQGAPLRMLLAFDDGRRLRLGGAGDGDGIVIDSLPLDPPADLGPAGRLVVEDIAPLLGTPIVGTEVRAVNVILLVGQRVGVRLSFSGTGAFYIWLDGDELYWGDDMIFAAHLWPADGQPRIGPPLDF